MTTASPAVAEPDLEPVEVRVAVANDMDMDTAGAHCRLDATGVWCQTETP